MKANSNKEKIEMPKAKSGKLPFVLGILSVFPGIFLSYIGIVLSALAIIFGASQMKKAKNRYAKIGLVLGIISLMINIILSIAAVDLLYTLVDGNKEIKTLSYDEANTICLSKKTYLGRTSCVASVIGNNLDNPHVKSGEICSQLTDDAEKLSCVLHLSRKTSDENHCNILAEGDGRTVCLAISRKDETLCNQLPFNVKIKCLDKISSD